MNADVIKGKWNQMKGDLKTKWGKLTDDEFMEIAGNRDKLIGKLQEKYGRSKEDVTREVDTFFTDYEKRHGGTQTNIDPNRKIS